MGLPSGTKWAASNLDVKSETGLAASPFQYECSFFSWGNIEGHNPVSETAFDYNFGSANQTQPWYEGQPYGETPGSDLMSNIPINAEFDAARALLGAPWHTPDSNDIMELITGSIYIDANGVEVPSENVDKRVTINGIVGVYLQSRTNGNRLFLPATGYGDGSSRVYPSTRGDYWTRTFQSSRYAHSLYFGSSRVGPNNTFDRHCGFPIRPVMK